MARLPKLNLPDIPQHIVQRGNNRQACIITKQDRAVYLGRPMGEPLEDMLLFKSLGILPVGLNIS